MFHTLLLNFAFSEILSLLFVHVSLSYLCQLIKNSFRYCLCLSLFPLNIHSKNLLEILWLSQHVSLVCCIKSPSTGVREILQVFGYFLTHARPGIKPQHKKLLLNLAKCDTTGSSNTAMVTLIVTSIAGTHSLYTLNHFSVDKVSLELMPVTSGYHL